MNPPDTTPPPFDFERHRVSAEAEYQRTRPLYASFVEEVRRILRESLAAASLQTASVDARAKEVESLGKSCHSSDQDSEQPKYSNPLEQITDLAGVRVIVFFPKTVAQVEHQIKTEFLVIDRVDKGDVLRQEGTLGYQSVHFLVKLAPSRTALPEYRRYRDLVAGGPGSDGSATRLGRNRARYPVQVFGRNTRKSPPAVSFARRRY